MRHGIDDRLAFGTVLDDQPSRAGTTLAEGDVGGLHHQGRQYRFRVARVPHDQRIVAAEPTPGSPADRRRTWRRKMSPAPGRAANIKGVDRLIQQGRARLAPALDQVHYAWRQLRRLERLGHELARQRCLLRRLERDHRVAREQRAGMMCPVRQVASESWERAPSTAATPCGRWRSTARPKPVSAARSPGKASRRWRGSRCRPY